MDYFDDRKIVADQLNVFQKYKCKSSVVIKQMSNVYNEKDALVFNNKKLVGIIECKKRYRCYSSYILEVPKLLHWWKYYKDLDFIYLNRLPTGDYYLNVNKLGLEEYISNNDLESLDGNNGVTFQLGSRTDRGWNRDQDRRWLLIDRSLFKKVV